MTSESKFPDELRASSLTERTEALTAYVAECTRQRDERVQQLEAQIHTARTAADEAINRAGALVEQKRLAAARAIAAEFYERGANLFVHWRDAPSRTIATAICALFVELSSRCDNETGLPLREHVIGFALADVMIATDSRSLKYCASPDTWGLRSLRGVAGGHGQGGIIELCNAARRVVATPIAFYDALLALEKAMETTAAKCLGAPCDQDREIYAVMRNEATASDAAHSLEAYCDREVEKSRKHREANPPPSKGHYINDRWSGPGPNPYHQRIVDYR